MTGEKKRTAGRQEAPQNLLTCGFRKPVKSEDKGDGKRRANAHSQDREKWTERRKQKKIKLIKNERGMRHTHPAGRGMRRTRSPGGDVASSARNP